MKNKIVLSLTLIFALCGLAFGQGNDNGLKPTVVTGEIVSVEKEKIVIQSKDGKVEAAITPKTDFKKVAPENTSLRTAISPADIGVGDKVAITGVLSADRKSLPARAVYLMTKADIAQKQFKDSERWKTRGISGKVTAINPQTKQISVEVRGLMSNSTIVLTPKDKAEFMRYAPNSVKYNEAVKSSAADVKVGDALRAVGDKSADGTTFSAEEVLTGAFQTVAGTVKSIDAAKGEVVITDIQTKKDVTVTVNPASLVKKFPEEMAQRMAQFQAMRAGGMMTGGAGNATGGVRPPQPPANGGGGTGQPRPGGFGGGGGGGMRGGNIDEMLENFKTISIADLKVGDMIAASSTKGADPTRITAIKLLAGVEPFLKTLQTAGGNAAGGRPNGGQGGFSIPGLDGTDAP